LWAFVKEVRTFAESPDSEAMVHKLKKLSAMVEKKTCLASPIHPIFDPKFNNQAEAA